MTDDLDPTDERWREMDAQSLAHELAELRALPTWALDSMSTRLAMAATGLAAAGRPVDSAVLIHASRLLYTLARELRA